MLFWFGREVKFSEKNSRIFSQQFMSAGTEFKAKKGLTDPTEIEFHIKLADTNLDTVLLQAEHLTTLMNDPNYHADI